jgi:quercetin dioxygenase-like cupin family protein
VNNFLFAACIAAATMSGVTPVGAVANELTEMVTSALQQPIPNLPGKSLIAVVVDYPPGAASRSHVHARSAFIYAYVVSGAIESQIDDGPMQVLHAGQSFYEPPGAKHTVSRNASKSEAAKLLAVFVVDTGDAPLTTPIGGAERLEKKQ